MDRQDSEPFGYFPGAPNRAEFPCQLRKSATGLQRFQCCGVFLRGWNAERLLAWRSGMECWSQQLPRCTDHPRRLRYSCLVGLALRLDREVLLASAI